MVGYCSLSRRRRFRQRFVSGEYTFTLFVVLAIALLLSWLVAGIFTPLLGYTLLPSKIEKHEGHGRAFTIFQKVLLWSMRHRLVTIGATFAIFAASVDGMQSVPKQFFPASDRPELLVGWTRFTRRKPRWTVSRSRLRAIPTSSAERAEQERQRGAELVADVGEELGLR